MHTHVNTECCCSWIKCRVQRSICSPLEIITPKQCPRFKHKLSSKFYIFKLILFPGSPFHHVPSSSSHPEVLRHMSHSSRSLKSTSHEPSSAFCFSFTCSLPLSFHPQRQRPVCSLWYVHQFANLVSPASVLCVTSYLSPPFAFTHYLAVSFCILI